MFLSKLNFKFFNFNIVNILENIIRFTIYLLVFLLPIFFLPLTSDFLDFNKQILLVTLVFLATFCWIIKSLILGQISFRYNKIHIVLIFFLIVYLLSTVFSLDKYGSFWGWPRNTPESFLTLIGLTLFYFLVSSLERVEISKILRLFASSGIIAVIIGIFHLFKIYLPFFPKASSFNTIGLIGGLGFLAAVLLPLLISLLIVDVSWKRGFWILGMVLSLFLIVLINYPFSWWLVLAGNTLLIILAILRREVFDLRWLAIPMFFVVLSLFFIILRISLPLPEKPLELYLKQGSSWEIALKTLKDYPLFGSGPGTFVFDFSKYKKTEWNNGLLWGVRFDNPASKIISLLATTGILGFAVFLLLILSILFYIFWLLLRKKNLLGENLLSAERVGVIVSLIVMIVGYFLYTSTLSLDFSFFVLLACFSALIVEKNIVHSLKTSSVLVLAFNFAFTFWLIFGLGLIILEYQRYIAEVNYYKAMLAAGQEGKQDEVLRRLEKAVGLNPRVDIYLIQLSQVYLNKLTAIGGSQMTQEDKNKVVPILINNVVNAANRATQISPYNVSNWSIRGFVYQSLIGVLPESEEWAIKSYEQAINLEPVNPYYPTQKGIVYMAKATILDKDNKEKKEEDLNKAKEEFEKAISLKSDYAPARFQIAMVYKEKGEVNQGITALEEAKKYAPNDIGLLFQVGVVYYQEGQYEKAKSNLESAIRIFPDYANALYFLGLTYDKLGDKEKAIKQFERVSELNPNNEEVKKIIANLKSGKEALAGIREEIPPKAPIEEAPPEKSGEKPKSK